MEYVLKHRVEKDVLTRRLPITESYDGEKAADQADSVVISLRRPHGVMVEDSEGYGGTGFQHRQEAWIRASLSQHIPRLWCSL